MTLDPHEPSVLDYVRAKLFPWKYPPVDSPNWTAPADAEEPAAPQESPVARQPLRIPWRALLALALALWAQSHFEQPDRNALIGGGVYLFAAAFAVWSAWIGEWRLPNPLPDDVSHSDSQGYRPRQLALGAVFLLLAFFLFGGNRFNTLNVYIWLAGLAFMLLAFWEWQKPLAETLRDWGRKLKSPLPVRWKFSLSRHVLVFLLVFALAAFFRLYRINEVPAEMVSDHAEKLLDVWDVLHGETAIFFPRNTGREFFQFYLTAAVIQIFGTGYSFLSLKIGTAICGLLTLPFIYLLGRELGSRRAGLLAMAFAGISYWINVITRVGLRFTLYPFFTAPALYFLARGLRRRSRNDFILSGLFLGLGLHGYSTYRIVPIVVVIAVGVYLLHRQARGGRQTALIGLGITALMATFVFLPLARYMFTNPDAVMSRSLSRLVETETDYSSPPLQILAQNTWRALTMFAWDNGEIWVNSIPGRPGLDIVSAALFYLGCALLFTRYLQTRHWMHLFLLVSIPLLMLPSILSLAFPAENPAPNRVGAAMIPVFLIVGITLDGLLHTLRARLQSAWGMRTAYGLAGLLLTAAILQNFQLTFVKYDEQYRRSAWNTSVMGQVAADFAASVGKPESVWVLAYPYWVDTRLVGMNAGWTTRDMAIDAARLPDTLPLPGPKLFLVRPEDEVGLQALRDLYPLGFVQNYPSPYPGKDFLLFFVPIPSALP